MKCFSKFAVAGLLAGLAWAGPAAAADITLKASHDANKDEPYHLGMVRMSELLESKTDGKAEINVFPNAQLGEEVESIQGVKLGTIDIAVTANAKFVNFVPGMKVFSMPFLFESAEHMDQALRNEKVLAKIHEITGEKGFRVLGLFSAGTRHIMTKDPIFSMEDLKGKKIRTMGNPAHVDAFNEYGANATPLAYNELYGALQTGVVDGAEAANTNYHSKKFYEVAGNWAMVGWLELVAPVVMSEDRFQELPDDVQTALEEAGTQAAEYQRELYRKSDQERFDMLLDEGVNVTVVDADPFMKASEKVYEEHLTSEQDMELLRLIKAAAEE